MTDNKKIADGFTVDGRFKPNTYIRLCSLSEYLDLNFSKVQYGIYSCFSNSTYNQKDRDMYSKLFDWDGPYAEFIELLYQLIYKEGKGRKINGNFSYFDIYSKVYDILEKTPEIQDKVFDVYRSYLNGLMDGSINLFHERFMLDSDVRLHGFKCLSDNPREYDFVIRREFFKLGETFRSKDIDSIIELFISSQGDGIEISLLGKMGPYILHLNIPENIEDGKLEEYVPFDPKELCSKLGLYKFTHCMTLLSALLGTIPSDIRVLKSIKDSIVKANILPDLSDIPISKLTIDDDWLFLNNIEFELEKIKID